MLNFRACPGANETPAPAFVLMNRNLRTRLPTIQEETFSLTRSVLEKQQKQKHYHEFILLLRDLQL